jgi:hypothetical protein
MVNKTENKFLQIKLRPYGMKFHIVLDHKHMITL